MDDIRKKIAEIITKNLLSSDPQYAFEEPDKIADRILALLHPDPEKMAKMIEEYFAEIASGLKMRFEYTDLAQYIIDHWEEL